MFLEEWAVKNKTAFRRLSIAFFILFLLTLIDMAAFIVSDARTVFKVVAGGQTDISGKLTEPVDPHELRPLPDKSADPEADRDVNHLLAASPVNRHYAIRFTGVNGRIWRGILTTEPFAAPADLTFQVVRTGWPAEPQPVTYRVFIYPDEAGYRRSYLSLTKRWTGFDPLWAPLVLLPVGMLIFWIGFRIARQEESDLQSVGIGPIYKLVKNKTHWEVMFGLGSQHGVRPGDTLLVLDSRRKPVGEIVAREVADDHTTATVDGKAPIRSEFLVARLERAAEVLEPAV
ncbi:MAG: hypothetical protein WCD88_13520 [Desulfobacterales bacterium]